MTDDSPLPPPLEPRKVRRVAVKDKAAVEAISEGIFEYQPGVPEDYLPLVYEAWVQDSDRSCFGLEIAGTLVGFTCRTLLDQGKTIWVEGTRITEQYRGYGLVKALYEGIDDQWAATPAALSATRTRWTGFLNDEERARVAGTASILFEGTFMIVTGAREQLRAELRSFEDFCEYALGLEDFEPLKEIRTPELLSLLQEPSRLPTSTGMHLKRTRRICDCWLVGTTHSLEKRLRSSSCRTSWMPSWLRTSLFELRDHSLSAAWCPSSRARSIPSTLMHRESGTLLFTYIFTWSAPLNL